MRRSILLAAMLSLAFAPAPFAKGRAKCDLELLRGEWVHVREESANFGVNCPEKVVVIVGTRMTAFDRGDPVYRAAIVLDAKRSPKMLELRYDRADTKHSAIRQSYRLDGDLLEVCYDPADWAKAPGIIS